MSGVTFAPPLLTSASVSTSLNLQLLEQLQTDPANRLKNEIQLQELLNHGTVFTDEETTILRSLGYCVSYNHATIDRFKHFTCPDQPALQEVIRSAHPMTGLLLDKFKAMRPGPASSLASYARGYDEVFAIFETQTTEKEAHSAQIANWLQKMGLKNGRLIDIGCGNGAQLKAIADEIPLGSVTAIDNQAGSIEKARALIGKPTWEFKETSAFSPLNTPPADTILMAHFYCAPEKINPLLENLRLCEKPNSLYILIHSAPQSDTGTLCSKLPFLRPRPAQLMSESFEDALKDRRYICEPHIVEARILFPALTPALISTLLNLPMGGYEDVVNADPDVKIVKALMEFIAGFPLEAFSFEERQLYINELEILFRSNGGNFLKICNRIILAHPETASRTFLQKFKEIHGDVLDAPWPLMIENYKKAYEQITLSISKEQYEQAEDVLTHWLKRLNLFHRNPAGNIQQISLEMAKGYLLLAEILLKTRRYMAALAVAWYALRIDPSFGKEVDIMVETIETTYLRTLSISSPPKWLEQAKEDREILSNLRSRIHEQLLSIEKSVFDAQIPALRVLYQQITQEMRTFFSHLLQRAVEDLANGEIFPPCAYAVAGLGSFAREETTPYSDLEFMIITESNDKRYFRALTTLFHARIINLRETILPSMDIGSLRWLFDDKTDRGIAFDGNMSTAAKTPHGKQLGKKGDYELIGPPSHLLQFQSNWTEDSPEDRLWAAQRYHLPTVLSNTAFIKGDQGLIDAYQKALPDATDHSLVLELLHHDLTTFDPKVSNEEVSGKMHQVKKDLYRLPTALLDSLARYFQLKAHSSWERVEELRDRHIFSKEAASDLLKLLMQVQALRLKTYFFHKAQKEDLPLENDLYPFYYIAIPFVDAVKRFYEALKKEETNSEKHLQSPRFFDNSLFCQGCIARRLLDYRKAELLLEKDPRETPLYFEVLADVKKELYKLKEAAALYQKLISQIPKEKKLIANIWIKLAQVSQEQALYTEAQRALVEAEKNIDLSVIALSERLSRLRAEFHMDMNDYRRAKDEIDLTLKRIHQRLANKTKDPRYHVHIDPSLGETLLLKAQLEQENCQFEEAERSIREADTIFRGYYQNPKHPKLARIHLLMGNLLEKVEKSEEALANEEQALLIYTDLFDHNHPDIATSYNNIGHSLGKLGKHKEALTKKEEALKIWQTLFGEAHPHIATSYHNIGTSLVELQKYEDALEKQKQGLEMQLKCLGQRHPLVAKGYDGIAVTLGKLDEHVEALKNKEQALKIRQDLFGTIHLDVAMSLKNIAYSLTKLHKHQEAIDKYNEAILVFEQLFGKDSTYLGDCYSSRGRSWYELKKYKEAFSDEEKSLKIYSTSLTTPYLKIAISNKKLGDCLLKLKEFDKAGAHYTKALTIFENHLSADAPEIAKCKEKINYCQKKFQQQKK